MLAEHALSKIQRHHAHLMFLSPSMDDIKWTDTYLPFVYAQAAASYLRSWGGWSLWLLTPLLSIYINWKSPLSALIVMHVIF
jgi:hypothetical protein